MRAVVGYEFLLDLGGRQEWSQLHGSGGAIGNGALHVQDAASVAGIAESLLRRARRDAERGELRKSNCARHGEPLTIEPVRVVGVLDCRPILSRR